MKKLVWNVVKRFLAIVPFVLLFLFMFDQLVYLEQKNAREKIISEHTGHLALMEYMVGNVFDEYYSTIHLIRNSNEMNEYLEDPSGINEGEVVAFFNRMVSNRPYIKGLLIGTPEGVPRFGLTKSGDTVKPFSITTPYLYIWQQLVHNIQDLGEGDIQFTSLIYDMDEESPDERIHLLGFVIPVIEDGALVAGIGMLVDGDHILSMLRHFLNNHPSEIRYGLVDSFGSWVFRYDAGTYFPHDPEEPRVSVTSPDLWDAIAREEHGELSLDGQNFHFQAFDPLREESIYYQKAPHFLVGIMAFSDSDIIVLEDSFLLRNKPLRWVLALSILLLGGFINLLTYFRRSDRELLAVSNLVSEQSHDGVVITDSLQHVTFCNRTFELMTGFSNDEILERMHDVRTLDGSRFDADKAMQSLRTKDHSNSTWQGLLWVVGKRFITLTHISFSTISSNRGHIVHNVGLYSDPQNLSRESYETMVLAEDAATGETDVYPLQLLEEKRCSGNRFVLVYMKLVNLDVLEAQTSLDEHYVLGAQIRNRISEVIGKDDLVIRYSPDTFLLTCQIKETEASGELKKLRHAFDTPFGVGERKQVILIRVGVSSPSLACDTAFTMIRQSRMALAALDHYRHQGMLKYDKSVDEHLLRYYAILQAFPEAMEQHAIQVFYQPVVRISTNKVVAAEALVRWHHPSLGPVSPAEFIPIVEQNGLERQLGRYVVEKVVRFLQRLQSEATVGIGVSMNLCPTELQDPDLVPHMVRTLDACNVSHDRLIIELTERTLLTDMHAANTVLDQLHKEQIKVAIDDFGTGFSSLSYLHELDVDLLKIDRSFIKGYPREDDGVILKAMIGMARELAIPVLVEGIETPEQLAFLKEL